jgi:hypothetical protein
MTPDALWRRYADVWSRPDAAERSAELAACLAEDATYCDPNGLLAGRAALSEYMGQFQAGVPGGRFQLRSVLHHHGRSLAHWSLHGADERVMQTGTSFGMHTEDGKLRAISGFFYPENPDGPA